MLKYRKSTWALIAWTAFVGYRLVIALSPGHCHNSACGTGRSIAAIIVLSIGAMGFILLALVWSASRPSVQPPVDERLHVPTA